MECRRVCVSPRLFAWPLVIQVLRCLLERSNLEIWSVNLSGLLEYPSSRLEETTRCFKRDKRAWKLSSENFILRTRVLVFNSFLKFKHDRVITGKFPFLLIHIPFTILYIYFFTQEKVRFARSMWKNRTWINGTKYNEIREKREKKKNRKFTISKLFLSIIVSIGSIGFTFVQRFAKIFASPDPIHEPNIFFSFFFFKNRTR